MGSPWCRSKGHLSLKRLTVDDLTQFRSTWPDSPISTFKQQERLKGFFYFCVARERTTPVLGIKPVKVPPSPTLPFEEDQMTAILDACDRYPIYARNLPGRGCVFTVDLPRLPVPAAAVVQS